MDKKESYHFETRAIHEGSKESAWEGATLPPIFNLPPTITRVQTV